MSIIMLIMANRRVKTLNFNFFVLWWKKIIPEIAPNGAKKAKSSKANSLIRSFFLIALYLSIP